MSAWMTKLTLGMLLLLTFGGNFGCRYLYNPGQIFNPDSDDRPELAKYGSTINQRIAESKKKSAQLRKADEATRSRIVSGFISQIRNEQNYEVRIAMLDALAASRTEQGLEMLRLAKKDPNKYVREKVCHLWGATANAEATRELTEILNSDTDIDVQMSAAVALGTFKSQANVQALSAGLRESDIAVKEVIMESLRNNTGRSFDKDVRKWDEYVRTGKVKADTETSISSNIFNIFRWN